MVVMHKVFSLSLEIIYIFIQTHLDIREEFIYYKEVSKHLFNFNFSGGRYYVNEHERLTCSCK